MLYYNNNCLYVSPPVSHLPLVEVYNCKVGSSDCSQCWGREDQGHLCGWCENSCKLRDDCQSIMNQCPAPEIHKVRSQVKHATNVCVHCPTLPTPFLQPSGSIFGSAWIMGSFTCCGAPIPCLSSVSCWGSVWIVSHWSSSLSNNTNTHLAKPCRGHSGPLRAKSLRTTHLPPCVTTVCV